MWAVPDETRQAYERATGADDPLQALRAVAALRETLGSWETELARLALHDGVTWEAIGAALGISRQAAWERMRPKVAAAIAADRDRLQDRVNELETQRRKHGRD